MVETSMSGNSNVKKPKSDATRYFISQFDWWDKIMLRGLADMTAIPALTPNCDPGFAENGNI